MPYSRTVRPQRPEHIGPVGHAVRYIGPCAWAIPTEEVIDWADYSDG